MSILSGNNLITTDILFKHGFNKKADYSFYDLKSNIVYNPDHFYKDINIKVKTLDFDNRDFSFFCRSVLDYEPISHSITLFCKDEIFSNNIIFKGKVEDETDLMAVISHVESHIYYPL